MRHDVQSLTILLRTLCADRRISEEAIDFYSLVVRGVDIKAELNRPSAQLRSRSGTRRTCFRSQRRAD